jgi:hypothetical protein
VAAAGGPGIIALLPAGVLAAFLPPFARGLVLGAGITAVLGIEAFLVVQATGTAPVMAGDDAEQWSAQELRWLRRHRWRLVNHFSSDPATSTTC